MPITLLPSLLLAIVLVGFTPGPANLFSLHCSMKNGTKKAMTMWFGLLTGFTIAATLGAVVTHLVGAMMDKYVVWLKYIGCAYILYLAWQIYRSKGEAKASDHTCTFLSGMVVQLTNAKIIIFDLMAYSTFVLPYSNHLSDLLIMTALLEIAGPGANLVYLLAGAGLHDFYDRYPKQTNTVMAILLSACAIYILLN